jgi:U3 small nucleolar RNA-associated protein 22
MPGVVAKGRNAKSAVVESFVRDLQACYSQSMLLFYGGEYGDIVAGLWNPQTTKPKNWSLKMAYSTTPASVGDSEEKESSDGVSINKTAIVNEISRLGTGLIEGIEVHNNTG